MEKLKILAALNLFAIVSCQRKEPEPPVVDKNFAEAFVGRFEYLEDSYDKRKFISWRIYKFTDSTISLSSLHSVNGYPGWPVIRKDSVPLIELSELSHMEFTHQNTDPFTDLRPGGYLFSANGDLAGNVLSVTLKYKYSDREYGEVVVTDVLKLKRK